MTYTDDSSVYSNWGQGLDFGFFNQRLQGIKEFMLFHVCNALCRKLRLEDAPKPPSMAEPAASKTSQAYNIDSNQQHFSGALKQCSGQ
ncbi:hypothetical protein OE88DRAFT_1447625 [Heliocybe sulcata]|uniref:Alpha-type protein kinase domain-containing protein n=1 Tax=Heliocybe sulcata TaxID=5364 RepID=A0A5C3N2Z7_9AGAM|nr:hypothetical protein OE88DRAFT_1447625 [Heliocybe sulcata]